MRPETVLRRREAQIEKAVSAVRNKMPYRQAEREFRVAKSTIFDRIKAGDKSTTKLTRAAFRPDEGNAILQLLLRCADRGFPLTIVHVREAAEVIITSLPEVRRAQLPFKDNKPGYRWVRGFYKRYLNQLNFAIPNMQEAKRFRAVNAETLSTHYAALEALVKEYGLDDSQVWNLDETGVSPGKDVKGTKRQKRFLRRDGGGDCQSAAFAYSNRITMMAAVSAAGAVGPSLWVFKGNRLPCRDIIVAGTRHVENLSSRLPDNALVNMRDEVAGVDSASFYQYAVRFTTHIQHLVANGRKVLLTYDGYRSHMSVRVLEHFKANNVVVYALPAHKSGKLQPLETGVYRAFKHHVNASVSECASGGNNKGMDVYQLCSLLRMSYLVSFTAPTIMSAFRRSGLWPVAREVTMSVPRPRDVSDVRTLLAPDAMDALFAEKRAAARRRILGDDDLVMVKRGYVDTTRGEVLTSEAAIAAANEKAAEWRAKEAAAAAKAAAKARREAVDIARAERARWDTRARLACMPETQLSRSAA